MIHAVARRAKSLSSSRIETFTPFETTWMELLNKFIAWINGSAAGERRDENAWRLEGFLCDYHSEILERLRLDYTPVFGSALLEQANEQIVPRKSKARDSVAEARVADARHVLAQVVFRCLVEAVLLHHLEKLNQSNQKAVALRRELDSVRGGIVIHMHSFLREEQPSNEFGIRFDTLIEDPNEKLAARQLGKLQIYGNLLSIGAHDATLPSRLHISSLAALFQEFRDTLLPSYFAARVRSRALRNSLAEALDTQNSAEWEKLLGAGTELLPYDYDLRVWQEWHKNFRLGLAHRLAKIYHELIQQNKLNAEARAKFGSLFPAASRAETERVFFRERPLDDSSATPYVQVIDVDSAVLVAAPTSDAPAADNRSIALPSLLHVPLTLHINPERASDARNLAYCFYPPFVELALEFWDFATYKAEALTLQDYPILLKRRCLMTAPPLGGKTWMHGAMIQLHHVQQLGPVFYLDLEDFAYSGLSFFAYASRELSVRFHLDREKVSWVQEKLLGADFANQIFWHLDGWDRVPDEHKPNVAIRLRDLSQFLLSTSDPPRTRSLLEANKHRLSGIVRLLPFDELRIEEYLNAYVHLDDEVSVARLRALAKQLPHLAKLPGGLEHICTHARLVDVVRILFAFLDRTEASWNGHAIHTAALVERDMDAAFAKSRYVQAAYEIVKRSRVGADDATIGDAPRFTIPQFAEKLQWLKEWEREKTARAYFDLAARARIIARAQDDDESYQLNIPEIGYLLDAMIGAQVNPLAHLNQAYQELSKAPDNLRARIGFAYAAWRAQFFQLQQIAETQSIVSTRL